MLSDNIIDLRLKIICKQIFYALKNPNIRQYRSEIVKGDKNPFYGKTHKNEAKQKIGKASTKLFKWLTPTGEIKIMNRSNAGRWHLDWIKIGEV